MPGKRTEVVEKVHDSQIMPDIYESWLERQKTTHVLAKSGFVADWKVGKQATVANGDIIDTVTMVREREKRRSRGRGKR